MIKLLITLWQRPEITEICFQGVERIKKHGVSPICIYSDDENKELVEKFGFEGYYHENLPLGKKLNFGLKKGLESEWDYLIQIGSDDLLSDELFEIYKPWIESKEPAFGISKMYYYDIATGKAAYHESDYPFGCARMIHRDVLNGLTRRYKIRFYSSCAGSDFNYGKGQEILTGLDAAMDFERWGLAKIIDTVNGEGRLWTDHKNKSLDFDSDLRLKKRGVNFKNIRVDGVMALDIKSDTNIWPFEHYAETDLDVLKYFPESDAIRKTGQIYKS
jgi:hypothetical protein